MTAQPVQQTETGHTEQWTGPAVQPSDSDMLKVALFKAVDFDTVRPMLHNCQVHSLEPGHVLITAGRPNRHVYVVLSGALSVHLKAAETAPITEITPGEVVGEMSMFDQQPTSAFVVAQIRSRVLAIDEELLWMLVNSSHAISANLLYMLARRLRYGNELLSKHHERLAQYEYHATVDALTGLYNRHWLGNMLPRQIHRSRRCGEPLCMLMIDIDHFKVYNDEHGHVAGDAALGAVAEALRESLRPTDMAARYGGEEFLVLLPNCAQADATVVAERLRSAVEQTVVAPALGPQLPSVTISIGIGELPDEGTVEAFVSIADRALYRAKSAGRNQVSA